MPGNACRPKKADVSKIQLGTLSAVNEATTSATVVCPFHYQSNPVGVEPRSVKIRMINRSGSSSTNISCTVFSFNDNDITTPGNVFQATVTRSGSTASMQTATVTSTAFPGNMFSISCTLPGAPDSGKRSEIVNNQIVQQ